MKNKGTVMRSCDFYGSAVATKSPEITNKLNIQPRPRKRTKERKAQNANQSRETLNMYSCNSLWIDKAS